jgi:diguanylate cyclase (GGDEF)-like protein
VSTFLYTEINLVGIVLLLLLLYNLRKNSSRDVTIDQRIFIACMIMNILVFLFDSGMWLLDGNPEPGLRISNYIMTTLYYISNPLICFIWLLYTDFKIHESKLGLQKRSRLYAIPLVINSLLSLASPFTGWFFIIDAANNYARGPLFPVFAITAFFYLLLACGISLRDIIKQGWEVNKSVYLHLVVFPVGLILASVIQILFFGMSLIWICATLAFTSIYINIQNGQISTDYLTGLYNRRHLEQHLQRRINARRGDQLLFAIMLDLDVFKSINDKFGHAAGDSALVKMADLLRQVSKHSDDFIARMGGDEFIILGERAETAAIEHLINEISALTDEFNQSGQGDFALLPSMGYSIFGKNDMVASFLAAADKEMYRNKDERKLEQSL